MNRFQFVLAIATALGIVFLLSCSKVEDIEEAVQKNECASNQGDWDANAKKCVRCPEGTYMSEGQCVALAPPNVIEREDGTTTIICPARTKLDESGKCVADIIEIDPNAATSKYYCDYGKLDSLVKGGEGGCFEIEYTSECDKDWGKLVASCQDKDRRNDLKYCDYGPVDEYGGGCYLILSANDCDKDWGIVATQCGTHGKYPNGTVCPAGKVKRPDVNECQSGDAGLTDGTATHCDWGAPYIDESGKVQGDCWPINDSETRQNCLKWGKGVKICPTYSCPAGTARKAGAACEVNEVKKDTVPSATNNKYCYWGKETDCWPIVSGSDTPTEAKCESDYGMVVTSCSNVSVQYCNWGKPYIENGTVQGGCWSIKNATEKQNCPLSKVVNSCQSYTCPAGTTNITNNWGDSGCELSSTPTPSNKYCFYGKETECWPIDSSTTEAKCESDYGMVVTSCSNVTWDFCDWGKPVIENGVVDRGCFAIRNAKDRSDCQWGTILRSCPDYTCPAGTTKADWGWGQSACELIN